jgi:hypothetical protein
MSTTLPNIGLVVPASGDTDYPTSISTSMTNLDNHDHTTGKGVQIPTGGIVDLAVTTAKIANSNVTTAKIADLNVTRAKLVAVGQQISNSSGTFSTASGSLTDVTNLSVTITTTGRPVILMLVNDGASLVGGWLGAYQQTNVDTGPQAEFAILRDGSSIAKHTIWAADTATPSTEYQAITRVPVSSLMHIDPVAAGTYTYKVQARYSSVTVTTDMFAEVYYAKLVAYEL